MPDPPAEPRLVGVSVFAPFHTSFTYREPLRLQGRVRPGARVVVPFGGRHLGGVATSFPSRAPDGVVLKEILAVTDDEPVLDGLRLELADWMTHRWLIPPGECLNLFLPPGSAVETSYAYFPSREAAPPTAAGKHDKTLFRDKVLALIRTRPGILRKEIARIIPAAAVDRALAELEKRGEIVREARVEGARTRFKTLRFVDIVQPAPDPSAFPARQKAVLEYLLSHETPIPAALLLRAAGAGGEVLKALEKKKALQVFTRDEYRDPFKHFEPREREEFDLTHDQAEAVRRMGEFIQEGRHGKFLLFGVTGSGKTLVYIRLIEKALARGRTAVMLVPEIALTPALTRRLLGHFGTRLALFHSMLSDGERHDQWHRVNRGEASVVVGTRSAIFTPLRRPGVVILDEEHDPSYKQDENPRYHAREVAARWAELTGAALVLGSATPSVESFHAAVEQDRYTLLELPQRVMARPLPRVEVVDLAVEFQRFGKGIVLAGCAFRAIGDRMAAGEQVMVLLNRRGFAPLLLCRKCGNTLLCQHCNVSMTFHASENRMLCHHCGFVRPVPTVCEECGSNFIQQMGVGTEKLQSLFQQRFPGKCVERFDRDTTRERGAMKSILERFEKREIDLLVGTQMIAKGHDFPGVTLVVVLSTDISLRIADFRSAERTFQLLTQVAGRSGRGDTPGEVFIQTYYPNHYAVRLARNQDYRSFYHEEILFRQRLRYPPFARVVLVVFTGSSEAEVSSLAKAAGNLLREAIRAQRQEAAMRCVGPVPALFEKIKDSFRWSMLVRCFADEPVYPVLRAFHESCAAARLPMKSISIDVDPVSLS